MPDQPRLRDAVILRRDPQRTAQILSELADDLLADVPAPFVALRLQNLANLLGGKS